MDIQFFFNKFFSSRRKKWNVLIDNYSPAMNIKDKKEHMTINMNYLYSDIQLWLRNGGLDNFYTSNYLHKKGLEFFLSANLLNLKPEDEILDAAGGRSDYLKAIRLNGHKGKLYLNDHIFHGVRIDSHGVNIVGGDVADIQLPDQSIDKLSCHHAFEHFQKDKDTRFIFEIYRILKPGGSAVITPIFIAKRYIECWNIPWKNKFDDDALLVIDETASLPGGDEDGHFARIYDIGALERRVLEPADALGFACTINEMTVDGLTMPDMEKNFGSKLNNPLRALVLEKK